MREASRGDLEKERERRAAAERAASRAMSSAADLRAALACADAGSGVSRLRAEAATLRTLVHTELPKCVSDLSWEPPANIPASAQ
jgi:hypothetical protein